MYQPWPSSFSWLGRSVRTSTGENIVSQAIQIPSARPSKPAIAAPAARSSIS
jgi:hypothetical protein